MSDRIELDFPQVVGGFDDTDDAMRDLGWVERVVEAAARLSNTLPYQDKPRCFHTACLTERPTCEFAYAPCCSYAANLMLLAALDASEGK